MRLSWLLAALALALSVSYIQHEALAHLWYWHYPWLDTFVHFLGGLAVASFGIAILDRRRALVFLGAMLSIAVGWEVFEYLIHAEREANFAFDTALDLLMDALGMSLAYVTARYTIWRSA
jgi:hypothetical protein